MPDAQRPGSVIADFDRDSIHTLPLSVLPVSNTALSKARLIKNHRLETRIELFREAGMLKKTDIEAMNEVSVPYILNPKPSTLNPKP